MDKKEQTRLRVQRYRDKQKGVTLLSDVTPNPESVTQDVTQYPAILRALVDPEKRVKLEKIYQSLSNFKQAENVYYGCGKNSVPFDVVGDLLEVTK